MLIFRKELLWKKTLIILAHPDLTRSMANKKLKEEVEKNTDIIVHNIYEEYPNGKINLEKDKLAFTTKAKIKDYKIELWEH